MANLSNINNKFLFTDGDFLKIGNLAPINNVSSTESGISVINSNVASLSLTSTAATGKTYALMSEGPGGFRIRDIDANNDRLIINTSGKATFSGNVALGDSGQLQLGAGNDAQIYHDGGHLFIDNSTGSSYLRNTSTGSILLRNSTGGDIQFDNEFAGNILFNTSNIERMRINSSGNVGIGETNPNSRLIIKNTSANDGIRIHTSDTGEGFVIFRDDSATSPAAIVYDHNIDMLGFKVNGFSDRLIINADGNVGIGTTAPRAKLEVDGELIAKDIKHSNFAVASVNTTGYTIATVTGSSNGASAIVEFTGIGGTNGVVDVVYSCTNQGGNWYATARPRQTAIKVDVVVTGNGTTTLSFVFKSLSGTQGYTPRLMMKGSPSALVTF